MRYLILTAGVLVAAAALADDPTKKPFPLPTPTFTPGPAPTVDPGKLPLEVQVALLQTSVGKLVAQNAALTKQVATMQHDAQEEAKLVDGINANLTNQLKLLGNKVDAQDTRNDGQDKKLASLTVQAGKLPPHHHGLVVNAPLIQCGPIGDGVSCTAANTGGVTVGTVAD